MKKIDLTGQKFGRLAVSSISRSDKRGQAEWLCKCECGNELFVNRQNLKSGNTSSCGCIWQEKCTGRGSNLFKGGKLRAEYRRYASAARKRKFEFTLTFEEVQHLFSSLCHYCGSEGFTDCRGLHRNGIDRKDSSKGYHTDNVVASCKMCNLMKRTFSYADFIAHTKKIVKNLKAA